MTSREKAKNRLVGFIDELISNIESTEKGTTVDSSIGDDTLIGSVCERSEAEGDKFTETVDGDPIGLNIETKEVCRFCGKPNLDWWNDKWYECKDCGKLSKSEN